MNPPINSLPSPITVPVRAAGPTSGSPVQQAFHQVVMAVEGLRTQLRELQTRQTEARRRYWQQVGPVASTVVAARRALYAPLEESLLLACFNRQEEKQITSIILGNARTLQERFGEDEGAIIAKYAPARRTPEPADDNQPLAANADQPSPAAARPPRKNKAQKAQEAAERQARDDQQRLLTSTKTVYRQLARAHHPDLTSDPTQQQARTAKMQRITAAYEADDLFALLQLLADSGSADHAADDVLTRYTQALLRQQTELKLQIQALKFGPDNLAGSPKKQELELRQLKRDLRAEAEYLQQIQRLISEPLGLREALRELAAQGQESF